MLTQALSCLLLAALDPTANAAQAERSPALGPGAAAVGGEPAPTEDRPIASFTVNVLSLLQPAVEGKLELAMGDSFALGVVGGYVFDLGEGPSASGATVGLQAVLYPVGDFRTGLQIGGEAYHLAAAAETEAEKVVLSGWAAGGFLGGKVTTDGGLTLEGQVGVDRYEVSSEFAGIGWLGVRVALSVGLTL